MPKHCGAVAEQIESLLQGDDNLLQAFLRGEFHHVIASTTQRGIDLTVWFAYADAARTVVCYQVQDSAETGCTVFGVVNNNHTLVSRATGQASLGLPMERYGLDLIDPSGEKCSLFTWHDRRSFGVLEFFTSPMTAHVAQPQLVLSVEAMGGFQPSSEEGALPTVVYEKGPWEVPFSVPAIHGPAVYLQPNTTDVREGTTFSLTRVQSGASLTVLTLRSENVSIHRAGGSPALIRCTVVQPDGTHVTSRSYMSYNDKWTLRFLPLLQTGTHTLEISLGHVTWTLPWYQAAVDAGTLG